MNRIRFFVREDPSIVTQTSYNSDKSSTWIVTDNEGRSSFEFEEVRSTTKYLKQSMEPIEKTTWMRYLYLIQEEF